MPALKFTGNVTASNRIGKYYHEEPRLKEHIHDLSRDEGFLSLRADTIKLIVSYLTFLGRFRLKICSIEVPKCLIVDSCIHLVKESISTLHPRSQIQHRMRHAAALLQRCHFLTRVWIYEKRLMFQRKHRCILQSVHHHRPVVVRVRLKSGAKTEVMNHYEYNTLGIRNETQSRGVHQLVVKYGTNIEFVSLN
ncbi:hypothetical protein BDV34DRAFT_228627 [Aspergillus parasiticus]|uniref:Uncharacterized protein n=1 Tax=Aspergillus parasiticus TaxID=5067 RepID=A0A5N6DAN1_ASPPA|nr:hypothetical protein BDV34DRAFT_228627 [Aspergillus parasiticus]